MTHRRLRPWVIHTIEAIEGIIIAAVLIAFFIIAFYAFTGFNLLWFLGLIGGTAS